MIVISLTIMAFIHKPLEEIVCDSSIKKGDKISIYHFDNEDQVAIVELIYQISIDNNLDVNQMLTKYFPINETNKKKTYTFTAVEKCQRATWLVLQTDAGEEIHTDLADKYLCFYSVN
jgi:hypothetical protein